MTISVIDFFSGCGGTSLGLREAGMTIVAGIDHDADSAESFRLNFPDAAFIERDIRQVSTGEVRSLMPHGVPTLFAGCAPCQPFSKQNRNRHRKEDSRRLLIAEFQRFVLALKPTHVVVENVPGLQRFGSDGPLAGFIAELERANYTVVWAILHASHFGVPQRRSRFVLIASQDPLCARMPIATHGPGRLPIATVREWMSDLPSIEAGASDVIDRDHVAMSLSETNLRRILATPEGGGRDSWPSDLLLDCHQGHKGHSDVYGRLAWDKPASAMTTRCLSYSNGRFGHPEENRAISVREAACLQTFPRHFQFAGTVTSRGRQIGNAVPPLLSRAIGSVFTGSET